MIADACAAMRTDAGLFGDGLLSALGEPTLLPDNARAAFAQLAFILQRLGGHRD
jgi:hypothetical protein